MALHPPAAGELKRYAEPRDFRVTRQSLYIVAVFLGFLPAQGAAQQLPALPERLDTLTVRYAETVIGRGIMRWTRQDGTQLQVYTWTSAFDGSSVIDSLFSDPSTLRPTREVRVVGDTTHVVEFEEHAVIVRTLVPGSATAASMMTEADLYSSASIEMLVASMPLVAGASRDVRTFYAPPSRLGTQSTRIVVVAREVVDDRAAWRVTASTPGGGSTFWVDESSRTVLRMDTREGEAVITFRR